MTYYDDAERHTGRGMFDFIWEVRTAGYRWNASLALDRRRTRPAEIADLSSFEVGQTVPDDVVIADFSSLEPEHDVDGPFLVPNGRQHQRRRYRPLQEPGLHRRFAALKRPQPHGVSPDAVRGFANQHGLLGQSLLLYSTEPGRERESCWGESWAYWHREITWMALLLYLWDRAQRQDAGALGRYIHWDPPTADLRDDPAVTLDVNWPPDAQGEPSGEWWAIGQVAAQHLIDTLSPRYSRYPEAPDAARLRYGEVIQPAKQVVCEFVSERLAKHVTPQVVPWRPGRISLHPDTLLSAMYVQFAQEIAYLERPPVPCAYCGRYFTPLHGRQAYCDERCRKGAYRQRHKSS